MLSGMMVSGSGGTGDWSGRAVTFVDLGRKSKQVRRTTRRWPRSASERRIPQDQKLNGRSLGLTSLQSDWISSFGPNCLRLKALRGLQLHLMLFRD
eukprot:3357337-Amphidinium_carterae.1